MPLLLAFVVPELLLMWFGTDQKYWDQLRQSFFQAECPKQKEINISVTSDLPLTSKKFGSFRK